MSELWVIGSRAGSPGKRGAASGYVLLAGDKTLLVDCGPGVVVGLTARGLASQLGAVVISHAHADHCADLVALAYHRRFPEPLPPLPLYAPAPVLAALRALDEVFGIPTLEALRAPLSQAFHPVQIEAGKTFYVAERPVRTHQTVHPGETLAMFFTDLGLCYTADGALTEGLRSFARGATTLLAEATYLSGTGHDLQAHGHMTAAQAGQLARDAGVERLVLTHFSDDAYGEAARQRASSVFSGDVLVATPGLRVPLHHV